MLSLTIRSQRLKPAPQVMDTRLVWLMVLRVVIITTLLGSALTAEVISRPEGPIDPLFFLIALTYLLTIVYAVIWVWTAKQRRLFAYAQIVGDLGIITGIVYFTGGIESSFSFLYYLAIIAASIILYRRGGLVAASLATILYGTLLEALHLGIWFTYPAFQLVTSPPVTEQVHYYTIFLNCFAFFSVAVLTSYLSESLRQTGQELEETSDHLADLEVFNQTLIDSITAGLMTTDLQGRINFLNDAAETILAVPKERATGQSVTELLGESPDFITRIRHLLDGRRYCRLEGDYLDGKAKDIHLGMSVSYLLVKGELKGGLLFIFQDLTDIKQLERQVRLKENLASMGEMAAGMAHEIRNPLASISGSVQVLKEDLGLEGEQCRLMDIIVRESDRLSSILNEFLSYARPRRFEPREIDLAKVVEETATLLRNSAEVLPEHEITVKVPRVPVNLFADPNQMTQIVWNLSRNGLQAMPRGGSLEIELTRNGSGEVVMAFRDQGVGIRDGEIHEVFKPFSGSFERGSGLGLAIVYRIVRDYNGAIRIDSLRPRGTEVSVHFPLRRRAIG